LTGQTNEVLEFKISIHSELFDVCSKFRSRVRECKSQLQVYVMAAVSAKFRRFFTSSNTGQQSRSN